MNDLRISIIGSGNVASHLAIAFDRSGVRIHQVCGRNRKNVNALADKVGASKCYSPSSLSPETDVIIIAVNDDTIADVVKKIRLKEQIVLHTAGSVPMNALKKFPQHGVFWPLQTFSTERKVIMEDVPVCVEGSDRSTLYSISNIASAISGFVYHLDSEQRKYAHLAAVFANNFSNHMFMIADQILEREDLPFDLVRPLILETALKVLDHSPRSAQTGPAKRGDKETTRRQLQLLKGKEKEVYRIVSDSIARSVKKKK